MRQTLSLKSCRTVAEADERLRRWVGRCYDDRVRANITSLLTGEAAAVLDEDGIDAFIDEMAAAREGAIEDVVAWFHRSLASANEELPVVPTHRPVSSQR